MYFQPEMDLMNLEKLLKFYGEIFTRSRDIWIWKGQLSHFDSRMSVKVKETERNN